MPENCMNLSPDDINNLFLRSNNFGLENNVTPANHSHLFNFSEEHFAKILQGFWSSGKDRNLSSQAEAALITIYTFLIIGGLITNFLVCFVVARRKQMHTARNLYIVNLTVSDISLCLICMPFTLVMILRRQWTLGPVLCKLVSFLQATNIMVSVGTITVIALDRYFTICKKKSNKLTNSKQNVIFSITCLWFLSSVVAMPLLFYQVRMPPLLLLLIRNLR